MSQDTALLDANVLYPAPIRDLLLQLAVDDLFQAKWTATIHAEWIEALLHKEPWRDRAALERTRQLMDTHVRSLPVMKHCWKHSLCLIRMIAMCWLPPSWVGVM
jgi:hypothetical protein